RPGREGGGAAGAEGCSGQGAGGRAPSQRRGERALEQAEVQAPSERAVTTALVAFGVELAIAPARIVVLGDRLGHVRGTLTAGPLSDKDRPLRATRALTA